MEIILNPIDNYFYELCRNSKQSIQLCAPFVKDNIIKEIIRNKNEDVQLTLVTNININHIYTKTLDTEALKRIIKVNGSVFNRGNLHAKYYIFDNQKVIITSGNLTSHGLKNNYEYGVFVDDAMLVQQSSLNYNNLITDKDTNLMKLSKIKEIETITNGIKNQKQIKLPNISYLLNEETSKNYAINSSSVEVQLKEGWKKDIFHIIDKFKDDIFLSEDLYQYANELSKKHSSNHNVEAKIRQILQQLRDIGLIEFIEKGKYKRLWISLHN